MKKITLLITAALCEQLGISDGADEAAVAAAIGNLAEKAKKAEAKVTELNNQAEAAKKTANSEKVKAMLEKASDEKKITNEQKAVFEKQYEGNPDGLKEILDTLKPYEPITSKINTGAGPKAEVEKDWTWDDYQEKDKSGKKLDDLKATNRQAYDALFEAKYGRKPRS